MTAPVPGEANLEQVNKLISLLSNLRAGKLIEVADPQQLADYRLDEPQVRLSYTFLPPQVFKIEPQQPDEETEAPEEGQSVDSPPESTATPYQPPAETYELAVSRKDAKVYLTRAESEQIVYVIGAGVMDDLLAEYRQTDLFSFEPSQVSAVMLTDGDDTQGFRNTDSGWQYVPERDIPIAAKTVTNYLLRIKNLNAVRFADYAAADFVPYGLDTPRLTLTIEVEGATLPALEVSARTTDAGERFARLADDSAVFLLPPDALERIRINIEEFEQTP